MFHVTIYKLFMLENDINLFYQQIKKMIHINYVLIFSW